MARRDGLQRSGIAAAAADKRQSDRADRAASLRHSAKRALELIEAKRDKAAAAKPKAKNPKKSKHSGDPIVDQVVSREAQAHGDYQAVDFKLQEVTEGGKRKEKAIRVVRNIGGTPIDRWHAKGTFNERQMAAILFYQHAWRLQWSEARITASYSPAITRNAVDAIELYAGSKMAAKESLRLIDHEVFLRIPPDYFPVWQNVVIWDEPAGIAGSRAGWVVKKAAEAAAKAIVVMCATMIADVVIDQSRRDFGDLLINLDRARKPRSRSA